MKRVLLHLLFLIPLLWSIFSLKKIMAKAPEEDRLNQKTVESLREIKTLLLSGDLSQAKQKLSLFPSKESVAQKTARYYLAIILYLEGRYQESQEIVDKISFDTPQNYRHLCYFKFLLSLETGQTQKAIYLLDGCVRDNDEFLRQDGLWSTVLLLLKRRNPLLIKEEGLSRAYADMELLPDELLASWFKLGLYLGKEKEMDPLLKVLNPLRKQSPIMREIEAFYDYRFKRDETVLTTLENLDSVNSLNMKGELALLAGDFEKAFSLFKSAYDKNPLSNNAIERLIPLSWILNQNELGEALTVRQHTTPTTFYKKKSLQTAWALKKSDLKTVKDLLDDLESRYQQNAPLPLTLLGANYALLRGDNTLLEIYTRRGCFLFDGASCLLMMQTSLWPSLAQTLLKGKEEKEILHEKEFSVSQLKQKATITPLKSPLFIEQREIEELDQREAQMRFLSYPTDLEE